MQPKVYNFVQNSTPSSSDWNTEIIFLVSLEQLWARTQREL